MSFPAFYDDNCVCCGERFKAGSEIEQWDGSVILSSHLREKEREALGRACPKCFLIHAGECF